MANRERDEQEEQDPGFKVEDKRRFDASGEARAADEGEAESDEAAGVEAGAQAAGEEPDARQTHGAAPPELTFASFVQGLAHQALMCLGATPDPHTGVVHKDLGQAKEMIDILSMLSEKTAGNLSEDEAHMMDEALYLLRMQYVRELRGEGETGGERA